MLAKRDDALELEDLQTAVDAREIDRSQLRAVYENARRLLGGN